MWLEKTDFGIKGGGDIGLALMIDRKRGRQAKRKTEADGVARNSVSRADRSMTACAIVPFGMGKDPRDGCSDARRRMRPALALEIRSAQGGAGRHRTMGFDRTAGI